MVKDKTQKVVATIICKTFSDDMYKRLRILAALRGTSMQNTIKYALTKFIEDQEKSSWYITEINELTKDNRNG